MNTLEKEFFTFIYKRQLIWYKRFILKEEPPWTKDAILKTYKILNMYRELDACTLYLMKKLKNIHNRATLLLNTVFYRFFNQRDLYEHLHIEPFNHLDQQLKISLLNAFEQRQRQGHPIFNDAYIISSGDTGRKKHESILHNLQKTDWSTIVNTLNHCKQPRDALNLLQTIPMVGPLLSCEIWTDLSYFHFFKQGWTDNDFVNIGPGAKWGLEILAGKKLNTKEQYEQLNHIHHLQKQVLPIINKDLHESLNWNTLAFKEASSNVPFLSLTNIEGALCEFRKYHDLKKGKGKRRYFHHQ